MAKTDGYSKYSCDVQCCERTEYAQPNTDTADDFKLRKRITDEGVEREIMVCGEHNETYSKIVSGCEKVYIAFEKDGSYTLATKEEVDDLNAQLEQLQADYDAVRKNRDGWVTKYNQLKAEYDEYKRTHPDADGDE